MAKRILYPFATSGDKIAVSDETQSDGVVSYQQGYGAQYSADITSDPTARRVNRDRFNQVLFDITENTQEWQNQLYPDFILAANNGGTNYSYKKGMIVTDTNGDYRISLIEGNSDDTTTSNWADAWPIPVALGGTGAENAADARTNLGVLSASTSQEGLVELATVGDTQGGASALLAVTPNGLLNAIAVEDGNLRNAIADASTPGIGVDQTWQTFDTTSRNVGITYTNSSGRPIVVTVETTNSPGNNLNSQLLIDGVIRDQIVMDTEIGIAPIGTVSAIVPDGSTYRVDVFTAVTLSRWSELR